MKTTFNNCFKIYLFLLLLFIIYYLYQKHLNLVEWTVSEWLINYQGGFTRRGLIGEMVYQSSLLLTIAPRKIIFIFQIFFYALYFLLVYFYIKDIKKNYLLILAIFSPIFLLYPLAEVEVLARKEIFLFITFIIYMNICKKNNHNQKYYFLSFLLPLMCLIWEGVFFYITFFIFLTLLNRKEEKLKYIKTFISLVPFLFTLYLVSTSKLNSSEIKQMCNSINECYGAMHYLGNSLSNNINEVSSQFKFVYLIRYLLIFFFGFFPILFILYNSKFDTNSFFQKFSPLIIFFIVLMPSTIFYFIAIDWGRWINISYTLTILSYLYCIKNDFIKTNISILNSIISKYFKSKIILIFIFIIFAFGWNPKTLMKEDVGSFPGYRIIYKTFKHIMN